MKQSKKIAVICAVVGMLLCAVSYGYVQDYYHAQPEAAAVIEMPAETVSVLNTEDETIVFAPKGEGKEGIAGIAKAGIAFYPGAKVEYIAYAPLLEKLAEQGYLCVLYHMPANLAILNADAFDGLQEEYPEISRWYLMGHSLGGAMAAGYAADHGEQLEGLILLAAYSTKELPGSMGVLSIYGSEDQVLNRKSYEKYRENLPKGYTEVVIEGGCHAHFAAYGEQKGDGTATITREEQIEQTVQSIVTFLEGETCIGRSPF